MSDDEYDLIKSCVRRWRRRYCRDSDAEYYGIAWEAMENARQKWNGCGDWVKFARQRITFGLMSEHRTTKRKYDVVLYNPDIHGPVDVRPPAIDYIDEIQSKMQREIFDRYSAERRKRKWN